MTRYAGFFLTLLLIGASPATGLAQVTGPLSSSGTVRGTVFVLFEFPGVRMPGVEVTFSSQIAERSVTSNRSGDYEIDLPPGLYTVTTQAPGFFPAQRAPFEVVADRTTMINLTVNAIQLQTIARQDPDGMFIYEKTVPKDPLQTEIITDRRDDGHPITIRYVHTQAGPEAMEYGGTIYQMGETYIQIRPVLTYDALTIYADKIILNSDSLRLRAFGDVTVDDGVRRRFGNQILADLGAADPIATLQIQGQ